MNSNRTSNKPNRTKSQRQDCIDYLGVRSEFCSTKKPSRFLKKGADADADSYAASLLVGRTFQYVTRKGERKNYAIRSYIPWNGTHRVQRCSHHDYKTKVINLNELPSKIRWLDDDNNDLHAAATTTADVPASGALAREEAENRKRKQSVPLVSPLCKKSRRGSLIKKSPRLTRNVVDGDSMVSLPSPQRRRDARLGWRKPRTIKKPKTKTSITRSHKNEEHQEDLDACKEDVSETSPSPPKLTGNMSASFAEEEEDSSWVPPPATQPEEDRSEFSTYNGVTKVANSRRTQCQAQKVTSRAPPQIATEAVAGDRIAFGFGTDTSVHFGTVTDCGIERYDQALDRIWTVSFDIGETYELDCGDVTNGLELYEKVLEDEKPHPLPTEGSPDVGYRIALGFGVLGIHFGCIKNCVDNEGKEQHRWTVEFDDGEVHEFVSSEIHKGMDLYRRIRERKDARSLLQGEPSKISCGNGPTVGMRRLLGMVPGDRIAYDFGTTGVHFGSIEESYVSYTKSRKYWTWDIVFDDGYRYKFDSFEMTRAITLYEKMKEIERNSPKREEKIRKWREDHLAQKQRIEKSLPKCTKTRFLEVGFARWEKSYLPVLFLGPYDVFPGSVREQWLNAFDKVGDNAPNGKIPQIVYWLGVTPDKGFSILKGSDCLSLSDAKKQGLLKRRNTKSKAADKHNHTLFKLKEAVDKAPGCRSPLGKIREVHERVSGPKADRLLAEFEAVEQQL
jgi:hypothetical protein